MTFRDGCYVLTIIVIVLAAQFVWDWWARRTRNANYEDLTRPFWSSDETDAACGVGRSVSSGARSDKPSSPAGTGAP